MEIADGCASAARNYFAVILKNIKRAIIVSVEVVVGILKLTRVSYVVSV